jgi:hypothetical protein
MLRKFNISFIDQTGALKPVARIFTNFVIGVLLLICSASLAWGQENLAGEWSGWGGVNITGGNGAYEGTYNDTFGGKPGRFTLRKTGDRRYEGNWGESERRFGTFTLVLSQDRRSLEVSWSAAANSPIGPGNGGVSNWTRLGPVPDDACPDVSERIKDGTKQTRKWILAESVAVSRGSAVYLETDKKVLRTLSTVEQVMELIGKLAREDEFPVMKIPMKYFKEIVKSGDEIVQAAGRLSAAEKKKLVDISIRIELVEVTVECGEVEACQKGTWTNKGFRQFGTPKFKKLPPVIKEEQSVLIGELWKKVDKYTRSYAAMQERYDADPCDKASYNSGQAANGPKEDCGKYLAEAERLREQKSMTDSRDLANAQRELEKAQTDLEEWNAGLDKFKQGLSERVRLFEREVKTASVTLRTVRQASANLAANPNSPDPATWKANVAAADEKVAKAEKALRTAEADLEEVRKRRDNTDKLTADKAKLVDYRQEKVNEVQDRSRKLQLEIDRLQREYDNCKNRNK